MPCPHCQQENPADARLCSQCGHPLALRALRPAMKRVALPMLLFNAAASAAIYLTVREIKRRRAILGKD